jgi:hypothetical protein
LDDDTFEGFKARPMPVFPAVFTPKSTSPLTVPEMPCLLTEQRGLQKQKLEEQRRSFDEQSPVGFVSRPMPIFATPEPVTRTFQPTQFEPFRLYETSPSPKAPEPFSIPVFKARPMPDFSNPFTPTKSQADIEVKPFELRTDERAVVRSVFEEQLNDKRRREAEQQGAEASKQREQEEAEIQNYRRQLVFKAKPMPQYAFFEPQYSERPLTEPHSPFSAKKQQTSGLMQFRELSTINLSDSMELDVDMMDIVD